MLIQVPVGYLVVQAANGSTPGDVATGVAVVIVIALIFGSLVTRRFVKKLEHPAAVLAATR